VNDAVTESAAAADPPGGRAWWLWPVDLALVVLIGCVAAMLIGALAAPFSEQTLLRMALGNVFFSAIVGFQFLLIVTLPALVCNLAVSIPAALALRDTDPSDDRSTLNRLLAALMIWAILAIGLFRFGYVESAGIRPYGEPLSLGYRICHGLVALCWFLGPALFQWAMAVRIRPQQVSLGYRIARVHFGGLAIFSVAVCVIGGSIYNGGPLHAAWFTIPSGYNIGYIEPHAILFYTTGVGLLMFVATCIWSKRRFAASSTGESPAS
jgi:hypothetical protein